MGGVQSGTCRFFYGSDCSIVNANGATSSTAAPNPNANKFVDKTYGSYPTNVTNNAIVGLLVGPHTRLSLYNSTSFTGLNLMLDNNTNQSKVYSCDYLKGKNLYGNINSFIITPSSGSGIEGYDDDDDDDIFGNMDYCAILKIFLFLLFLCIAYCLLKHKNLLQ